MTKTIIFACTHSAGRSQMAAAFFNRIVTAEYRAVAAGLEPADRVHPEVVEVMREVGLELSSARPQQLTARMQAEAFFVVTMGCGERCPMIPQHRRADWELDDPKGKPLGEVRRIRDEVRALVENLVRTKSWAAVS